MTSDIPYPFRQNTDFLYLCGFQEPDSVLLLHTTPDGQKSVLFVPKRDQHRELWDGPRSGDVGALQLTGVSEAKNIENLENYLFNYCKDYAQYIVWYDYNKPIHAEFHTKIFSEFLNQDSKRALQSTTQLLHGQRLIKSAAEIELMKTSVDIASEAFIDVMKYSYPGVCTIWNLTLCLQGSFGDNLCKQFGPKSGPTKCLAWYGSKLFGTLMVFLKNFLKKVDFEKSVDNKKSCTITQ